MYSLSVLDKEGRYKIPGGAASRGFKATIRVGTLLLRWRGHLQIVNFVGLTLELVNNWLNSLIDREHQQMLYEENRLLAIFKQCLICSEINNNVTSTGRYCLNYEVVVI